MLTSVRHARALYDLDDETARELGPFAARVMRAQREVLGAEHAYAFAPPPPQCVPGEAAYLACLIQASCVLVASNWPYAP